MGNTYIDDEGRLRLWHDDNHQMVELSASDGEVWLEMDSWSTGGHF